MNAAKVKLTEAAVLAETIAFFGKPGSFVNEMYFKHRHQDAYRYDSSGPGADVYAACAIGGIEQAVWKLTHTAITHNERRMFAYLVSEKEKVGRLTDTRRVYARVMGRVNRIAAEMFGLPHIEAVTLEWSPRTAKKKMLLVLEAAAAEVRRK